MISFAWAGYCNDLNVEAFRYKFTSEELTFIAGDIKQLEASLTVAVSLKEVFHVLPGIYGNFN